MAEVNKSIYKMRKIFYNVINGIDLKVTVEHKKEMLKLQEKVTSILPKIKYIRKVELDDIRVLNYPFISETYIIIGILSKTGSKMYSDILLFEKYKKENEERIRFRAFPSDITEVDQKGIIEENILLLDAIMDFSNEQYASCMYSIPLEIRVTDNYHLGYIKLYLNRVIALNNLVFQVFQKNNMILS